MASTDSFQSSRHSGGYFIRPCTEKNCGPRRSGSHFFLPPRHFSRVWLEYPKYIAASFVLNHCLGDEVILTTKNLHLQPPHPPCYLQFPCCRTGNKGGYSASGLHPLVGPWSGVAAPGRWGSCSSPASALFVAG